MKHGSDSEQNQEDSFIQFKPAKEKLRIKFMKVFNQIFLSVDRKIIISKFQKVSKNRL